jgi:hypothetical protein
MARAQRALATSLLAITVSGVLPDSAPAQDSDPACNEARKLAQQENSPWLGLSRAGKLTVIKAGVSTSKKALDSIIYLHSRSDQSRRGTVMAAKITFHTQGNPVDSNWTRAKNNFKKKPVSASYQNYQDYHNGVKEDFELKTNFHLTRGIFNSGIPFTTFEPAGRRRQLALPPNSGNDELSYRTYLLTFQGVRADGSCVTFQPFFPNDTKQADVEVVDLLPDAESDLFYHSSIKLDVSE